MIMRCDASEPKRSGAKPTGWARSWGLHFGICLHCV